MTSDILKRILRSARVVAGFAVLLVLFGASGIHAADDDGGSADPPKKVRKERRTYEAATTAGPSANERLNALSGEVGNLRKSEADTGAEVEEVKKAIAIKTPEANATPATIGEHVGALERDLSDTRKNISDNLGVSIHGLVDAGYEHNFNQPEANVNYLRVFDHDGFQLTQGNLHVEKDGTVGFVTDLNVGQTANTIAAATHYSNVSTVGGQWFDPTQYYLTYTAPIGSGLNIQAGRFVTLLGEETIDTYNNQNYNESKDLIFGFGIPFTHTGIRAAYTLNDYVAITGGLNNGWDNPGANNNGGPTGEGELTLTNKDKTITLALNGIIGSQALNKSNSTQLAIDPVFTWKPAFVANTTLITEYLYGSEDGPVVNNHSASWDALAQYIVYDWNAWESATRGEFFDDKDGSRTSPNFNGLVSARTLWEITQTFTYKVPSVTGLLLRGEYRHDQSNHNDFSNNEFVSPLTGQHLWKGQDTLSGAMIYSF